VLERFAGDAAAAARMRGTFAGLYPLGDGTPEAAAARRAAAADPAAYVLKPQREGGGNNLYGAQVGAKFDWHLLSRLRFSAVPKFLIAGNAITNTSTLSTGGGTFATFNGSGAPVSVYSNMGVFSWLGSVDTGLAWDVTDHWSLSLGYRVVGVGNIAQADGQWPANITTAADLSGITAGSSTIIHGGFAGFEGRY
jgi:hypothetical protein